MNYLRGFIAWIAFAIVAPAGCQWGALAALLVGLVLLGRDRATGTPADSLILECSSVAYFAALAAWTFAFPHSSLSSWTGALSWAWLAVTAWATLALGRPFTEGIAKRQTPPQVWQHPLFRRANVVITAAWATAFTLSAVAMTVIYAAGLGTGASVAVQIAGFGLPVLFTNRYRGRMLERAARLSR
ncbi:hypothetical protein ACIHFE_14890 [Streptomyces sp. NPDC052396]|uniref:hypothetical protein n=1 Tax=Streptomyces sp. NPDC052396 TaxID=3365689 RepID=UPI0037D702E8